MTTQDITLASISDVFNVDANNQATQIKATNLATGTAVSGQVPVFQAGGTVAWSTAASSAGLDVLSWTNANGVAYATDETYNQVTVNGTFNAFTTPSTIVITLASNLPSYPTNTYVIGQTALGQTVSGLYVIGTGATVSAVEIERSATFTPSTTYTFLWRAGKRATASFLVDANAPATPLTANQLGFASNLSLTLDGSNAGRYITDINIVAETARVDAEIARQIGDYANPSNSNFTQLGTGTLSTTAGWFNGANNTSTLDIASANYTTVATWLTGLGAIAPAGGTGTWTLPNFNIYIASILTPTALQWSVISSVTSPNVNTLNIFVPRNPNLPSGSAQGIFFIAGNNWVFQPAPNTTVVNTVKANSVNSLNSITASPVSILAGTGISINNDTTQKTITISNTSSAGITIVSVSVVNFVSSTTPSAGQTFTSVSFGSYASADYITVTVNGAVFNRSNYSLSGTVLTISAYLPSSCIIQVQPSSGINGTAYFESAFTTSTFIPGGANTLLNWAGSGSSLSALTYSAGVFTAVRNCSVNFDMDIVITGLGSANQVSIWFSKNGDATTGTRYGQRTLVPDNGSILLAGTIDIASSWMFRLATNDTIRSYIYTTATGNYNIGVAAFGGNTRLSVVEIA